MTDRSLQRRSAMLCRIVAPILWFAFAATCRAQDTGVRSQPPWAYAYEVDKAKRTTFLATTPALNDGDVWPLLACTEAKAFSLSLMDGDGFPFAFGDQTDLTFQLDERKALVLPAAVIDRKQITVAPSSTKELFPLLARSKSLSASVDGGGGSTHTYVFSLQPNDAALRGIDVHCFQSGA